MAKILWVNSKTGMGRRLVGILAVMVATPSRVCLLVGLSSVIWTMVLYFRLR